MYWFALLQPWQLRAAAKTPYQINGNQELEPVSSYNNETIDPLEPFGPQGDLSFQSLISWIAYVEKGDPNSRHPDSLAKTSIGNLSLYTERCNVEYMFNVLENNNTGDNIKKRVIQMYKSSSRDLWFNPNDPKSQSKLQKNDNIDEDINNEFESYCKPPTEANDKSNENIINEILAINLLQANKVSVNHINAKNQEDQYNRFVDNINNFGNHINLLLSNLSNSENNIMDISFENDNNDKISSNINNQSNSNYVLTSFDNKFSNGEKFKNILQLNQSFNSYRNFHQPNIKSQVLIRRDCEEANELQSPMVIVDEDLRETPTVLPIINDNNKNESFQEQVSIENLVDLDLLISQSEDIFNDLDITTMPLVMDNIEKKLVPLNKLQFEVFQKVLAKVKANNKEDQCLIQLLGPPGAGKSVVVQEIRKRMTDHIDKYFKAKFEVITVQATAFTGIASVNVQGPTVFTLVKIPIRGRGTTQINDNDIGVSNNERLKKLPIQSLIYLKNKFMYLRLLIIDEISFFHASLFEFTNQRFQEIKNNFDKPFGGINVLIVGDHNQLPPTGGKSLISVAQEITYQKDTTKISKKVLSTIGHYDPEREGGKLFKLFKTIKLEDSQRAKQDKEFFDLFMTLCDFSKSNPITPEFINQLKVLSDQDIIDDPSWILSTPIIVTGNIHRIKLSLHYAVNFATYHKKPVLKIMLPITKTGGITSIMSELITELYTEFVEFYFVPGMPGTILQNINVDNQIANGTECIYHSVTIINKEDRERTEKRLANAKPGEIVLYDGKQPPEAINVYISTININDWDLPILSDKDVIIPKPKNENIDEERKKEKKISKKKKEVDNTNLSEKIDTSIFFNNDQKFIISIPLGFDSIKKTIPKSKFNNKLDKFEFKIATYALNNNGAKTTYKVMGTTVNKIIVDLNSVPWSKDHIMLPLTMADVLVIISRVKCRNDLRILPLRPGQTYDHLYKLQHSHTLIGYYECLELDENGYLIFSDKKCREYQIKYKKEISKEKALNKDRKEEGKQVHIKEKEVLKQSKEERVIKGTTLTKQVVINNKQG